MKYTIIEDIEAICVFLKIGIQELADNLKVSRSTIYRIIQGQTYPSDLFLESFYSFAYDNKFRKIDFNSLKIKLAQEQYKSILFHGAKAETQGDIDLSHSRLNVDIGKGFYLGEDYFQSSSYIFANKKSSIYVFDVTGLKKLKVLELPISIDWMLIVCYYRGQLEKYKNHPMIKNLIEKVESSDVVIAPIADNNMYEIINQFSRGDITDLQATIALSASHLGNQHVLKTEKACQSIKAINRLYLCSKERTDIEVERRKAALEAAEKAQHSIEEFRRKGKYIDELFNE